MPLALAIAQVLAATAPVAAPADQGRLDACLTRVEADPAAGYEEAMAWAHEEKAREARWCAAQAMVKLERYEEAARRFETLAGDQGWQQENRLDAYSNAGNAWLLAGNGERARESFNHAVRLSDNHPDARIDRARAYAMLSDWARTEEDLSAALDKRPADPLALMLRATARMKRNAFDLALRDAEEAVRLDPKNVDALVCLGQAREAQRTGVAP
jgi:tetratricopeptide (TPR) repeat protein